MVIKDYGGGNFMKAQPINSKLMKDFNCGEYYKSYEMLGAHFMEYRGKKGVRFECGLRMLKEYVLQEILIIGTVL